MTKAQKILHRIQTETAIGVLPISEEEAESIEEIIHEELEAQTDSAAGSLPKEFDGEFYGYGGMGKIFIKTKCGDTSVLDVRGWGYLTGQGGGLAMDEEGACKTQDQFEAWVIEALNAYRENAKVHQPMTGSGADSDRKEESA